MRHWSHHASKFHFATDVLLSTLRPTCCLQCSSPCCSQGSNVLPPWGHQCQCCLTVLPTFHHIDRHADSAPRAQAKGHDFPHWGYNFHLQANVTMMRISGMLLHPKCLSILGNHTLTRMPIILDANNDLPRGMKPLDNRMSSTGECQCHQPQAYKLPLHWTTSSWRLRDLPCPSTVSCTRDGPARTTPLPSPSTHCLGWMDGSLLTRKAACLPGKQLAGRAACLPGGQLAYPRPKACPGWSWREGGLRAYPGPRTTGRSGTSLMVLACFLYSLS